MSATIVRPFATEFRIENMGDARTLVAILERNGYEVVLRGAAA
jgi:hypothetical protein